MNWLLGRRADRQNEPRTSLTLNLKPDRTEQLMDELQTRLERTEEELQRLTNARREPRTHP